MMNKLRWPIAIIVVSLLVGILSWSHSTNVISPYLIFLFMLVIPGLAFTRLFRFNDLLTEIILAVALSIVISTILSEFMVLSHLWSPSAGFAVLVAISIYGAFLQIYKQLKIIPVRPIDDSHH